MKVKNIFIIIILLTFNSIRINAQGVPPPPPPDHQQNGNQNGGGAPLGGGLLILLSSAALYAGAKLKQYYTTEKLEE